jgi:FYVE/RhoGEF/PH domain-containing protein 5/6
MSSLPVVSSAPPSTVDFPSVGDPIPAHPPSAFQRPNYPAFRRISLPTAPSLIKRHSVLSVQSFESTPEEDRSVAAMPLVLKNVNKKSAAGPMPQNERRRSQWKLKPINEALETKRRKIIDEFFETERSYVDGLNLIHSVRGILYSIPI